MSAVLRRGVKWAADSLRFLTGAFYWNFRKSVYVLRRRRGGCPCQNESDDSIPGKVRCDAVMHWHQPGRFRKICPLLVQTPEGWRCSVHASQVRPFWGRVVLGSAVGAVGLYLVAVLVVFAGFRWIGHVPVEFTQIAWPGHWQRVGAVQSDALFKRAMLAFREGRLNEAELALSTAQARDPNNFEAGLLLAQITMFKRSYLYADDLFANLWRRHPEHKLRTALVYHDTLLGTDRMDTLSEWAIGIASEDQQRASAWIRSALVAARSLPPSAVEEWLGRNEAVLRRLAPHPRRLLVAEIAARAAGPEAGVAELERGQLGALNAFYLMYHIQRLADWGRVREAQMYLDRHGAVLGDFDRQLTQAAIAHRGNDVVGMQAAFRAVLRLPLTAQRIERIAAWLIGHPDAGLYRELHARLRNDPKRRDVVDGSGMWVTGIACGAPAEAGYWKNEGRHFFSKRYPPIAEINFRSRSPMEQDTVPFLVASLSMPREIILSLFERVTPQVDRPTAPGRR